MDKYQSQSTPPPPPPPPPTTHPSTHHNNHNNNHNNNNNNHHHHHHHHNQQHQHHHPHNYTASGTPYPSYLSYYGPSSAPAIGNSGVTGGATTTGGNGSGGNQNRLPGRVSDRNSSSTTSSPLSSANYRRPLFGTRPYTTMAAAYSPYNQSQQQQQQQQHYSNGNYFAGSGSPHHQLQHQQYSQNYLHPLYHHYQQQHHHNHAQPLVHHHHNKDLWRRNCFNIGSKLQHLSNRLHAWKSVSIAISFLALILLTCKLYDVDREISYLQFVADEWLSPSAITRDLLPLPAPPPPPPPNMVFAHNAASAKPKIRRSSPRAEHSNMYSSSHSSPLHQTTTPTTITARRRQKQQQQPQQNYNNGSNGDARHHHNHRWPQSQQIALPLTVSSKIGQVSKQHTISSGSGATSAIASSSPPPLPPPQTIAFPQARNPSSSHIIIGGHGGGSDTNLQNVFLLIESLREDIEVLIVELWSSRTTLVLSLIFVFVYIMSWCWMAYAIRETTSPHDISLKTVLLLAIFAAVDIAASAGFVMVRVIMYVMRDYYFPRDMRTPVLSAEFNQLAAYTALRLVTLKSSTGVVDIFVSVIVGFLTCLRVYSVICAVAFYRQARKELLNVNNFEFILEKAHPGTAVAVGNRKHHPHYHHHQQQQQQIAQMHMLNGLTRSKSAKAAMDEIGSNGYIPKIRLLNAHKDLDYRFSSGAGANGHIGEHGSSSLPLVADRSPRSSRSSDASPATSSTSSAEGDDVDPATELKIQAADMPTHMQKAALQSTVHALRAYTTEKHIAESVKQNFDQLYEPTWHCIVGRNWGSCVTHTKSNYIRMLYKDLTILLYKSS